ncbi:HAD family hydrolase [Marisediminicola sp. LYQ134]|uniref:HAD family hydrolase n=1 Tax=Marisediminicola sp. LYQ134 TaxID=3391061 RepID=UPI0039836C76
MATFRAVGFDLDGTLFDHRGSAEAGVDQFLRTLHVVPSDDARQAWFAAEDEQFERWRSGRISFQEQRRARLRTVLPVLGVTPPAEESKLDELFEVYFGAYKEEWRAFPGSEQLLTSLRASGYRIGLLTNGNEEQQRDKLSNMGLGAAFDVVCASENIGVQKPDARAFRILADGLGASPSQCLYVGDNAAHDIAGAEAAGMRALLVDHYTNGSAAVTEAVLAALKLGPSAVP